MFYCKIQQFLVYHFQQYYYYDGENIAEEHRPRACFGSSCSGRCFILGMTVPTAIILSWKSLAKRSTLVKYQSQVIFLYVPFIGSTRLLTTCAPKSTAGNSVSLPRYGIAL